MLKKGKNPGKPYKYRIPALLVGLALLCAGCGKQDESIDEAAKENEAEPRADAGAEDASEAAPETEGPEDAETEEEEPMPDVWAGVGKLSERQMKNTDNEALLIVRTNTVRVTIKGNQEAEDAVNRFFADRYASWQDTAETYREMARQDYEGRMAMKPPSGPDAEAGEEGGIEDEDLWWNSYELGRLYSVMRADEQIISIVEDSYEYTGGAHPNAVRVAYNFDTQTGERMTLEDVASDLDEIRQKSTEYLAQQLPQSEIAEELFDDYAGHLEDILTDGTWYVDGNGFHIICNEYIITPHSAGILDFLLPFEEVDVVRERFQIAG